VKKWKKIFELNINKLYSHAIDTSKSKNSESETKITYPKIAIPVKVGR
jgi:hypothetical protein